jgi:type IV secretory pathway TrbD component
MPFQNPHFRSKSTDLILEGFMEVVLILAGVVGVVVGVGLTTWQLAPEDTGRFAWLVDAATDLSGLEKNLSYRSEQGFGVHRILSAPLRAERSEFVTVGRRSIEHWGGPTAPIAIGS